LVSCGARATEKLDDLRRGVWGKVFGEAHGRILPQKKKCAMQKIILDNRLQCTHCLRMSNTTTRKAKSKKVQVKILGQMVTVGTKKHAILIQQVKHFNDLASH
jgi:hypothetical protein